MSRASSLSWPQIMFAGFFVAFRFKMYLDDLEFLSGSIARDVWFKVGFILGVASWFLWVVAASGISVLATTILPLILALILGSIWVIVEGFRSSWREAHPYWVVINCIYIVGLLLVRVVLPPADETLGLVYAIFLGIQVLDLLLSQSLRFLERI